MAPWAGWTHARAVDAAGVDAVLEATSRWNPHEVAWAIEVESGWDPAAVNPDSQAAGLIQFLPFTQKLLKMPVAAQLLSRADQAPYVAAYFERVASQIQAPGDLYLAIAGPKLLGRPDSSRVAPVGSTTWTQNPGWREPNDGPITVGSVRRYGTPPSPAPGLGGSLPTPGRTKPGVTGAPVDIFWVGLILLVVLSSRRS